MVMMILDPFVSHFVVKLTVMAENEVAMLLAVPAEIEELKRRLSTLQEIVDAERRQFQETEIKEGCLDRLRGVVYQAEDILDEYVIQTEMLERGSPPPSKPWAQFFYHFHSCFVTCGLRHSMGSRIKDLNKTLEDHIDRMRKPQGCSSTGGNINNARPPPDSRAFEHHAEVVRTRSIDSDTRMLVERLLQPSHAKKVPAVYVIAGTGGIGKTTLARGIFNHKRIETKFCEIRPAWVRISKHYKEETVLKNIIMAFKGGGREYEIQNPDELPNELRRLVRGKKFFLVLDDVWDKKVWNGLLESLLKDADPGSRILVTTRDAAISGCMDAERCHVVQKLCPEDGWSLLCKMACPGGDERRKRNLKHLGMKIVDKCDGLPLALKTIGRVLRGKDLTEAEWEKVAAGDSTWSCGQQDQEMEEIRKQLMGEVVYPSYEGLSPQLKLCFVYCATFPKDCILRRDVLVPLWIAEGFIKASKDSSSSSAEDAAEEYWKRLVRQSLLQPDPAGCCDQGGFKMHPVVRSLALYLAQDECYSGDVQGYLREADASTSSSAKRRRVLIKDARGASGLDAIGESRSLRTIIFLDTPLLQQVPEDFHRKFPFLRVLDLSGAPNSKLPDAVLHLILLRYLNLSRSRITEIPETIRSLRNLQFLGLAECTRLKSLSDAIGELHNLRALDVRGTQLMEGMTKGIRQLRHLNRLVGFRVNNRTSNADGNEAEDDSEGRDGRRRSWCTLEDLKHFTQLKYLMVQNLERISSAQEAKRASLSRSDHLDDLRLICNADQHAVTDHEERRKIKEVFDNLRPPSRLQRLEVGGYFGVEYPRWMMSIRSCLPDLKHVELRDCYFVQTLPPLGVLHELETLHVSGAAAVEIIGISFLLGEAAGQAHNVPSSAFPKLKQLALKNMDRWKYWFRKGEDPAVVPLPLLEELVIQSCNKLRSLPKGLLHNVTRLTIESASSLTEIGNLPFVRTLKIVDSGLVSIYNLPALEDLTIVDCSDLRDVNIVELQYLKLEDQIMASLPNWLLKKKEVKEPLQALMSGDWKSLFASSAGQNFVVVRKLEFRCSSWLLGRCIEGQPEWPKIRDIPLVEGRNVDRSRFISYDKSNPDRKLNTNIQVGEKTRKTITNGPIGEKRTANSSSDLASPLSIVNLLLLVVGVAKLAFEYKSFLLPFLLEAAAAIQKN